MQTAPDPAFDARYAHHGPVCGVDEVGRGPWAGPIITAAVILGPDAPSGLNDSKKLSAKRREALYDEVLSTCHVGIGEGTLREIEELNVQQASLLAMTKAVTALPEHPAFALIDGNKTPRNLPCESATVVKGDSLSPSIAAA